MLVPPESSSGVLVMISNKSVSLQLHSRARRVNTGVSISPGLESVPGRDRRTDGRTDIQNYDTKYAQSTTCCRA